MVSVLVSGVSDRIGSVLVSVNVSVGGNGVERESEQKRMGMMSQSSSRNRRIPVLTLLSLSLGGWGGVTRGRVGGWEVAGGQAKNTTQKYLGAAPGKWRY